MSIRFLADANLDHAIVQGVRRREPSIDIETANDAGLEGLRDDEVLEIAASEGRVLVSHDKLSNRSLVPSRGSSGSRWAAIRPFHIPGEVRIDRRRGARWHENEALGDFAAHRFGRTDHGHRLRIALDDHLASGLDPFQDRVHP